MRAQRFIMSSFPRAGAALILALAAAPASATPLENAWKACSAPQTAPAERVTQCSAVLAADIEPQIRAQALTVRGFARAMQKDVTGAIADLDAAVLADPNLALAYFYRGQLLASNGGEARALADYDKAISLSPDDADMRRARGYLRGQRKQFGPAIDDLTIAIRLTPNPHREYFIRGGVYEDAGARDKAIADYRQALALDPENAVLRRHLVAMAGPDAIPPEAQLPPGLCSTADITNEQRVAGCTEVIASRTLTGWTLRTAYCNLGFALTEMQAYDRVIASSQELIAIDPKAPCGYLNRGRALYYKDDLDRAIADYTTTITLDPTFHEAYANRGAAYHKRGEFARAIPDYDIAIEIEPSIAMYHKDRANTLYYMHEHQRAIADLVTAIKLEPNDAELYVRRGDNYIAVRDFDRAIADFTRAIALDPNEPRAWRGRGTARQGKNQSSEAAADFQEAARRETPTAEPQPAAR